MRLYLKCRKSNREWSEEQRYHVESGVFVKISCACLVPVQEYADHLQSKEARGFLWRLEEGQERAEGTSVSCSIPAELFYSLRRYNGVRVESMVFKNKAD